MPEARTLLGLGRAIYGAGALLLGVLGLIYADFALQWEPVPKGIPGYTPLAYGAAILLLAGGGALLLQKAARIGAAILAALFSVWVLLHVPPLLRNAGQVVAWLGIAESTALFCGGVIAFAALAPIDRRVTKAAQIAFGLAFLVFGLSHFVYADFTAMMIPAFIPAHLFWAYFTGCGHAAAGVAALTGYWARLGTLLAGVMFGTFVIALHIPRVAAAPIRAEWTMLAIAVTLTGAVFLLASSVARDG